jgi:hypothetical protein
MLEVPVPAGEAFSRGQRQRIDRAIVTAQEQCGLRFSVYVGAVDGDLRERTRAMLAACGADQARTVQIAIDPAARQLEVVSGTQAAGQLSDHGASLGAMSMTTSFLGGDLAGGIVDGLRTMAEHAATPRILHADQP